MYVTNVDCIDDVIGKIQANIHLPLAFIVNYAKNSLLHNRTINPCILCQLFEQTLILFNRVSNSNVFPLWSVCQEAINNAF